MSGIVKNKKIIFYLIIVGVLFADSFTLAKLLVDWPASPGVPPFGGTRLNENSGLSILIKYFYEWAISLGGLAVFVVLVLAGFQFLTSAGNPAQMSEAKERMQSAALGLVLLLGSVLILNTINPQLTTLSLKFQPHIKGIDTCEEDKDCPENKGIDDPKKFIQKCGDGFCIPKLEEPPTKTCESVTLKGESVECSIPADKDTPCLIPTGAVFDAVDSKPEKCGGILQFYLRTSGGKCESLHSSAGVDSKNISFDEVIRCVKLFTAKK